MESIRQKTKKTYEGLREKRGYKNPMEVPRIVKVVVSAGTGSYKDPKKRDLALDRLARITGQRPVIKGAKQSMASFKIRQGDPIGLQVTLRGVRMYDFLDKLLDIAFPRTKDFRGISENSIDEMGNLTVGIREHTVFPETSDEELKDVFGLSVTVVTTARNRDEAKAFFEHLSFPFRKKQEARR